MLSVAQVPVCSLIDGATMVTTDWQGTQQLSCRVVGHTWLATRRLGVGVLGT